jgi:hypothetical protein
MVGCVMVGRTSDTAVAIRNILVQLPKLGNRFVLVLVNVDRDDDIDSYEDWIHRPRQHGSADSY